MNFKEIQKDPSSKIEQGNKKLSSNPWDDLKALLEQPDTYFEEKKKDKEESMQESFQKLFELLHAKSKETIDSFNDNGYRGLQATEQRASVEGLAVDEQDKVALRELQEQAQSARRELLEAIGNKPMQPEVKNIDEEVQEASSIMQREDVQNEKPANSLKERNVNAADLSEREASKQLLGEERKQLAEQIRKERKENSTQMKELREQLDYLYKKLSSADANWEASQGEYENLSATRAKRANSFTGRIKNMLGVEFKGDKALEASIGEKKITSEILRSQRTNLAGEIDNLEELLKSDFRLNGIKEKLEAHYGRALESQKKTVEQTVLRNNVFFVHTINEGRSKHNSNSNVSQEATFEDDLDILLSLEPSLAASSINPGRDEEGKISGLWTQSGGVIIGGGQISEAHFFDGGSLSKGIKKRQSPGYAEEKLPIEKIDEVAKERGGGEDSYNEFVIDNAEIYGYFQPAAQDKNGIFWAYNLGMKEAWEKVSEARNRPEFDFVDHSVEDRNTLKYFEEKIGKYKNRLNLIESKGIPNYVITEDRRLFECFGINDNGSLQIGKELTPTEAATGRAGLSTEKRKDIGEKLLRKSIFREKSSQEEAEEIIKSL
ncbi:MAG TPA: hypothetical protein P5262_03285 [Candidatus Moranbacteria bacterium]|nr:hypothetical protein [Candidatus Moranbacteria bacterium]